ncbi:hypothetical protein FNSP10_12120 [Fusobacterium nucleatum]|nr:hypothetical protein FNCP10_12210 [Fusobacterium nucleatum]BEP07838.1 hypothetical protein FNSP10_12120 [Fusobacterium nucleatum]
MARFFIYLFSFIFFASPSALYLLFKKEVQDKTTKNLKVLFLLKFFLFDLLFYGVAIFKGIEDKDITVVFILLFFFVLNLLSILIYNVYYSESTKKKNTTAKSKKNKTDKNISKKDKNTNTEEPVLLESENDIITQTPKKLLSLDVDTEEPTPVSKEPLSVEELTQLLKDEYVDTGRVLSFEYQGERDLIPLNREVIIRKVYQKNNIYYMNVVDIDTKRPKMFRLDRIISINLE